jgi:hypothetical protein
MVRLKPLPPIPPPGGGGGTERSGGEDGEENERPNPPEPPEPPKDLPPEPTRANDSSAIHANRTMNSTPITPIDRNPLFLILTSFIDSSKQRNEILRIRSWIFLIHEKGPFHFSAEFGLLFHFTINAHGGGRHPRR